MPGRMNRFVVSERQLDLPTVTAGQEIFANTERKRQHYRDLSLVLIADLEAQTTHR